MTQHEDAIVQITPEQGDAGRNAVAIVGMAGRFPRACDIEEFWDLLRSGAEGVSFFSDEQLRQSGVDDATLTHPDYVKAAAPLNGIEFFDAPLFGVSPNDARTLDPQHRLFLECAWEALEHAGYAPDRCGERVGVYAGCTPSSYWSEHLHRNAVLRNTGELQLLLGNDKDFLTTRVSYKLNLRGPSVAIQSACSTSLVAVHMACQAIRNGECSMALAGGVSVTILARHGYMFQKGGILSPDGHTRTFDALAEGCVPGDGVAIVVLKRLEDARADGDFVHAVIRGSAINNDGAVKVGFTAPSVAGQAAAITAALRHANVRPEAISYVEAHGTATALGDPVEVAALAQAFSTGVPRPERCALGSVKSNVGHLNAAAGVAGLIKTVLALQHRQLPPSLHFARPNPAIPFEETPFVVNTTLREWPSHGRPRRAGVSSFGVGGTNAHVVVEEAGPAGEAGPERPWNVIVLSAKTREALDRLTDRLARHFESDSAGSFSDVAFTLQTGRTPQPWRRALAARTASEAAAALRGQDSPRVATRHAIENPGVAFMFPGQGTQYAGMASQLYGDDPVFREHMDRCADILVPDLRADLRVLLGLRTTGEAPGASSDWLDDTRLVQPVLVAVEYALAQWLAHCGIHPTAMIGYSLGEYAAAILAGVFSLEDGLRLAAARGRLLDQTPIGAMLAVPLGPQELEPLLAGDVSLAVLNGPRASIVSGTVDGIERLDSNLISAGVNSRRLRVDRAFHSPLMDPVVDAFRREVARIALHPPSIPFVSNLTGTWALPEQVVRPEYWAEHLRRPVRFHEGLTLLDGGAVRALVEVGPGASLASLAARTLTPENGSVAIATLPVTNNPAGSETGSLLGALGHLWALGSEVDWQAHHGVARRRVPLPTYPFERQRHWVDPPQAPAPVAAPVLHGGCAPATWMRALPSQDDRLQDLLRAPRCWLVLGEASAVRRAATDMLRRSGHRITDASAYGEHGASLNVAPADEEPLAVLYFGPERTGAGADAEGPGEARGLARFLAASRALALAVRRACDGWLVTERAHAVIGDENPSPSDAAIAGLVGAVTGGSVRWRNIDLAMAPEGPVVSARRLLEEIAMARPVPILACRGPHAWVQAEGERLEPVSARPHASAVTLLPTNDGANVADDNAVPHVRIGDAPPFDFESENRRLEDLARDAYARRDPNVVTRVAQFTRAADPLCVGYAWRYLTRGDPNLHEGDIREIAAIRRRLGVLPQHERFFGALIDVLVAGGLVRCVDGRLEVARDPSELDDPEDLHRRLLASFPEFDADLHSLRRCADHYEAAISGRIEAVGLLYPDGRPIEAPEDPSMGFPDAVLFERVLSEWVQGLARPGAGRPLRILEVGGGNGRLTWHVVAGLRGADVEYTFTDLGRGFVLNARSRAAARGLDFLRFGVLDISKDAVSQGYGAHHFDLILAFNVVHATRDVEETLGHLKRLLASSGLLVLLEATGVPRWSLLQVGLAPGFWSFEDTHIRTSSPLLAPGDWAATLGRVGFASRRAHLADGEHAPGDHSVILAQHDAVSGPADQGVAIATTAGGRTVAALAAASLDGMATQLAATLRAQEPVDTLIWWTSPDPEGTDSGGSFAGSAEQVAAWLTGEVHRLDALERTLDLHLPLRSARVVMIQPPGPLSAATAALQAWMDAFASSKCRSRRPWVSVRWTSWPAVPQEPWSSDRYMRASSGVLDALDQLPLDRLGPVIALDIGAAGLAPIEPAGTALVEAREDRVHASAPDTAPELIAATEGLERQLAGLWSAALGVASIGAHDSFFELGGDSLLCLQVSSMAREAGLDVPPSLIVKHPTVAGLARAIAAGARGAACREAPHGSAPLAPPQQDFFEWEPTDPHHFNTASLWVVPSRLSQYAWRSLIASVVSHHDALRLRFTAEEGLLRQTIAPDAGETPFLWCDLAALPLDRRRSAMEDAAAKLQTTLNVYTGPIVRFAYFELGAELGARLLMLAHHLVVDRHSLQVLKEDLERGWLQLDGGAAVELPPRTTSYLTWVDRLAAHARTPEAQQQLGFWLEQSRSAPLPLPVDHPGAPNTYGSAKLVFRTFTVEETGRLVREIAGRGGVSMRALLLTSMLAMLQRAMGRQEWLVAILDHGRRSLDDDSDVTRTVGLLSTGYLIRVEHRIDGPDSAREMERTLAAVPHGGLDFMLLAYFGEESPAARHLRAGLRATGVSFNYVGRISGDGSRFTPAPEATGPNIAPDTRRPVALAFGGWIEGNRLTVMCDYSANLYDASTIERLMDMWVERLRDSRAGEGVGDAVCPGPL